MMLPTDSAMVTSTFGARDSESLSSAEAQANELGIGFRTDRHGALLNGEMRPSPVFFTLGPLTGAGNCSRPPRCPKSGFRQKLLRLTFCVKRTCLRGWRLDSAPRRFAGIGDGLTFLNGGAAAIGFGGSRKGRPES